MVQKEVFKIVLEGISNEKLASAKEAEYAATFNDLKAQIEHMKKTNPRRYEDGGKALELPSQ